MSKGTGPLSKLYNAVINSVDKVVPQAVRPLWESPAGPKTVFFWGPLGKWLLVLAGIGDIVKRPPQNVSLNQSGVLAATGLIWSRYSVVIIPKNYSLLAANFVVFLTQGFLIAKHLKWRSENPKNAFYQHSQSPFSLGDDQ
ncbi:mitochondrial pyruvate carrier 2 [Drosophila grimshawi]|uniref:Mitochondrial pyruvate carrier n=1 Tax=Drosophila grimshawi TaxID=7222 RepID=B4JQW5_DROGR|nr:mitochondrial pyruvate carrier 2 [Drosophila grimshawi]EDV99295.1 GH13770 [Drosophila grimshawi]